MKTIRWPVISIALLMAAVVLFLGMPVGASAAYQDVNGGNALLADSLPPGTIPFFYIIAVDPDKSVTIQTYNFPANDKFNVLMGPYGSAGKGGEKVAEQSSGVGGSFKATYTIPNSLKGAYRIAIRLESPTSGYFAYNWFYNDMAAAATVVPTSTKTPMPTTVPTTPAATVAPATPVVPASGDHKIPAGTYPYFFIEEVVADKTVTIKGHNFPANDKFMVTMGLMGTRGIKGTAAGEYSTGKGGQFTATFNIPAGLHNLKQISIRLESPTSHYFAYNWFYNNTTTALAPGATPAPAVPFNPAKPPVFFIDAVVRGKTVTITTYNFPANDDFKVTMGYMGTKGIGGYMVGTQSSGPGGSFSVTYTIPAELANHAQIAIRLQSPTTGYYAYNWFYNNTTTP